jgi:hypothetical protein
LQYILRIPPILCLFAALVPALSLKAQSPARVLFLGNSYTAANNLPQLFASVATSAGDAAVVDANTPGGYTLQGHTTNAVSQQKIKAGGPWDYVVLQEQSQLPSFPPGQVASSVFPFAKVLADSIVAFHPCAEVVFYRTWGRKFGDAGNCANWPPVCTYAGMDSLLALRYQQMADSNRAWVSPVGEVWRYLRQTQPNLELYDSDGSHPSLLGSYAAAVCFYSTVFQKSATLVKTDAGLNPASAAAVRAAVDAVVFDSLPRWNVGQWGAEAAFGAQVSGQTVQFLQQSLDAQSYEWSFGDGTTSTAVSPVHTYSANGSYSVVLRAIGCTTEDTTYAAVVLGGMGSVEPESLQPSFWPNPARDRVEWVPGTGWVEVLDAAGRCVARWPADRGEADVRLLAPGMYSLRAEDGAVYRWVRIR